MWKIRFTLIFLFTSGIASTGFAIPLEQNKFEVNLIHTIDHSHWVEDVAWSSDGKYLAIMDDPGQVFVWDAIEWRLLSVFDGCGNGNERLAWSPTQPILAIGCHLDTPIIVDEIDNQLKIVRLDTEHQSPAWSYDGLQLAVPHPDGTFAILNNSFETIGIFGEPEQPDPMYGGEIVLYSAYVGFKWSPSGNYLASVSLSQVGFVTIWDLRTEQPIQDFISAYDVAWSSDVFILTVQDYQKQEGSLQTWAISPLRMISSTEIPFQNNAFSVEQLNSNQYLAYCKDNLSLFDTYSLTQWELIEAATDNNLGCPITDIALSSNFELAIAENNQVNIWVGH